MRTFLTLVGFEYKKIFKRKGAIIALVVGIILTIFNPLMIIFGTSYIDGEPFENHYDAMVKDRGYAYALSGRAIDEVLLAETRDAYSMVPSVERYGTSPEFQEYARPYSGVFWILNSVYDYSLDLEGVKNLTAEDIRAFYQTRHDNVASSIRAGAISYAAKDMLIKFDNEIDTPFIYAFTGGFDSLFANIYSIGIICAFILAICLAPMFAGEYSTRADQLILSSKFGKNKLITAKLFTAFSIFALFFMLLIAIAYVMCMSVYGYDCWGAPFQLIGTFFAYPLTILDAVLIFAACSFLGTFLVAAITVLISSKFKSPFGVIIIVSVLLFAPMMIHVPETMVRLHNFFSLLPANMMALWIVFSHVPFDLFGLIVLPYVALPVFAILAGAAMLPFAWRGFRDHQIG